MHSDSTLVYVEKYFHTVSVFSRCVCMVAITLAPTRNISKLMSLLFDCNVILHYIYVVTVEKLLWDSGSPNHASTVKWLTKKSFENKYTLHYRYSDLSFIWKIRDRNGIKKERKIPILFVLLVLIAYCLFLVEWKLLKLQCFKSFKCCGKRRENVLPELNANLMENHN